MTIKSKYLYLTISLLLFAAAWCFWTMKYPYALAYHEQIQLFIMDSEYFMERVAMPGGLARYMGEFLVQMYSLPVLGGAIIALLYTAIHLSVWQLARKRCKAQTTGYLMSAMPMLALWMYMGDENMKLTFVVALLTALLAMMLCPPASKRWCKLAYMVVATPLLMWIAGPVVLVFALYVALRDLVTYKSVGEQQTRSLSLGNIGYGIFIMLFAIACILVSSRFVEAPLYRLFCGIGYSMDIENLSMTQCLVMLLTAIVPVSLAWLPEMKRKTEACVAAASFSVLLIAFGIGCQYTYREDVYDVMKYDGMVRAQKWDKIIATAEKKAPDSPLTVASLNLALAIKGCLNERAMSFYQNGWQGAFPMFNKGAQTSFMTSETYFYLGMVNSAQRLNFEAMEALPDNAKSARGVKRLAETNLINGQYDVARRYLMLLQKTMFYRTWATQTMALLGNEAAIDSHPLYGHLRKIRLRERFAFSEEEIDKIMGQLVMTNPKNVLAVQYLLLLPQLEGNEQKYAMYREFVNSTLKEKDDKE